MKDKLSNLQSFLQDVSDSAYSFSSLNSKFETNPTSYETHFASVMRARSTELSVLLNDIALEQAKKLKKPPKVDFNKFIRPSDYPNHKEVFVGSKWILVPNSTKVDFQVNETNSEFGFTVTVVDGENFATFTNKESYGSHELKDRILGESLHIEPVKLPDTSFDYKEFGEKSFDVGSGTISLIHNSNLIYQDIPNSVKRHYAYEISKVSKNLGREVKAGKLFQSAKGFSKSLKVLKSVDDFLGPVGDVLTAGNIAYEWKSNTWDAHTVVDGVLLLVGVVGGVIVGPEIIVGLAIYGILDFAFDFSEGIDENFGRNSDLWKDKPIYQYHREKTPLFNKVKIDNTYVAPKMIIKPNFKN